MDVLVENEGKIYAAIKIDGPEGIASPFPASLRYAVCGGENCEAWHNAVDIEFVKQHLNDPEHVQEAVHVMTSCHAAESADDVAFFFVLNTNFDYHDFRRYLVLHVGTGPAKEQVDAAVRKYALHTTS